MHYEVHELAKLNFLSDQIINKTQIKIDQSTGRVSPVRHETKIRLEKPLTHWRLLRRQLSVVQIRNPKVPAEKSFEEFDFTSLIWGPNG